MTSFTKKYGTLIFNAIINQDETIQVTNVIKHTLPPFEKEILRIVSQTRWKPLIVNSELKKCQVMIKVDYHTSKSLSKNKFISIEIIDLK